MVSTSCSVSTGASSCSCAAMRERSRGPTRPGVIPGRRGILASAAALVGATLMVVAVEADVDSVFGVPSSVIAATVCFLIRMLGVRFDLQAPRPPGAVRE